MDLTRPDLEGLLATLGVPRFHAASIFTWFYRKGAASFGEMTTLAKGLRADLAGRVSLAVPETAEVRTSADGARKVLLRLQDGRHVESVIMPIRGRVTLCISTQVGCRMGCRFCLTGRPAFVRDLSAGEIVGQVVACRRLLGGEGEITNVVFMGMGEPLDNYDNVMRAVRILYDDHGLCLSARRLTVSTVGLLSGLRRLAREPDLEVALAVSLNAADEPARSDLMPVNRKHPMTELLAVLKEFPLRARQRITIEYVLLGGVNDSPEDADGLARRLEGLRCMVNLIPFNPYEGSGFCAPVEEAALAFQERMLHHGYRTIIRRSRGADIGAACGQLRGLLEPEEDAGRPGH